MVPLARAMVARGHDVLWAVPSDRVGRVERTGIRVVAAGPPELTRPAEVRRRYPELDALPPVEVPEVMFGKMFGAIAAPAMLAELVPVALVWRPELVVADAAEFAGHIVAAELGVPSVTGALLPERRVAAAGEEVASLCIRGGLSRDRMGVPTITCTSTFTRLSSSPRPPPMSLAASYCVPSPMTGHSMTRPRYRCRTLCPTPRSCT